MELRIAARQPDEVGVGRRRFVGKRREGHDFGAGGTPALDEMRIDEGEGAVAREGDALRRRLRSGDEAFWSG